MNSLNAGSLLSKFSLLAVMIYGIASSPVLAANLVATTNLELTGTIIAQGCTVDAADVVKSVNLGSWSTNSLNKAGEHTSAFPFTVHLSGCSVEGVSVSFTGTPDAKDATLLALNSDSTASGVAVQIMDATQKRISMGDSSPKAQVDSNGDAELSFYANYVATDATVTAGTANADTEFTLVYD